jgi:hypothetical protein
MNKIIPKDASLVVTDPYISHFTSRKNIGLYPDLQHLPDNHPQKTPVFQYQYWLIKKSTGDSVIKELKETNQFLVEIENNNFILYKRMML